MDKPTLQVFYSCDGCGTKERAVTVIARQDEGVIEWMEKTLTPKLSADHTAVSPFCTSTKLSKLFIPVTDKKDAKIGGPVPNVRRPGTGIV